MAKIIVKAPFYKPGHKTEKGQSRGGYAQYIGTREGVEILRSGMAGYIGERHGSHGLFSDEGVDVSLSKISEEIDNHPGNVWGFIVSLKREDAERVGYNSAEQWVNLLRSRRNIIAKEMGIAPSNLRWVAAYHNKETNPHVHMMVWSSRPQEPYLSREGIHNIKKTFATDIYRQEHIQIYKKQTDAREDIKERCRQKIAELCAQINSGNHAFSLEILAKMELLSEKLSKHKGKKVYGYLDKNTKALVKDIVKLLGSDEQILELYDAWHSYKCEIVRTYTDEVPDKIPIEDNEEFKSIRNAVVKSAAEIFSPSAQPEREISYDYSELKERKNDFDFLDMIKREEYWGDLFYVEVMTGLRRGEICGLKWSDIDFGANTLRVQRSVSVKRGGGILIGETKTDTGTRTIVMPPSVADTLRNRKLTAVTDWVFPNYLHPEMPVHPEAAYRRLKIILKHAELPMIRFHDLRHTFATHATDGGVDPKTLSGILGHTNASFTLDTYTHVTTDMQKKASAVVGNMMKNMKIGE